MQNRQGPGGETPSYHFFAPIMLNLFLHMFQIFFSIFLESTETHFDPVSSKIGVKFANIKNLIFHRFQNITHFLDQKPYLPLLRGRGLHVVN